MWIPIIIGAALAFAWTVTRTPGLPGISDAEWLARVAVEEAGGGGRGEEWHGIMFVALNRASRHNESLEETVATTSWSGGGDRGRRYVERIRSDHPLEHRNYPEALATAQRLLAGEISNPIGDRRHFFHPNGMPSCEVDGEWYDRKLCVDGHLWPRWATPEHATYPPIQVGRAIFS